jgi:hypothetical protein
VTDLAASAEATTVLAVKLATEMEATVLNAVAKDPAEMSDAELEAVVSVALDERR